MKFSRKQCKNQQSGLFNPLRWQKFLAAKLAVFTGYRVGDLWNLHEGNLTDEPGVILKQIDEQMKSGNKSEENQAPHALPVTRQIDDLIAEARALRDVDRETLAKRFKWTKKELEALKKVAPVESDLIFPSLTGKNIGQKYGQKSDIMRDAFELLKGPKKDGEHTGAQFKKRARKQGRKRLPGTSFPKPHDLRATFSTLAVRAGYDFAVVSEFTNHTIPQSIMVAHYAASAMTDEQLAEAMQKINDFIEKTATDYRP
jgi:integrase